MQKVAQTFVLYAVEMEIADRKQERRDKKSGREEKEAQEKRQMQKRKTK